MRGVAGCQSDRVRIALPPFLQYCIQPILKQTLCTHDNNTATYQTNRFSAMLYLRFSVFALLAASVLSFMPPAPRFARPALTAVYAEKNIIVVRPCSLL